MENDRAVRLIHGRLALLIFTFIAVREKFVETWCRNSGRHHNNIILGGNNFVELALTRQGVKHAGGIWP